MSEIGFTPCPDCYLCAKVGRLAHAGLEDRLFGAPGAWNLKVCPDKDCGLLWLDPMPLLEDLPKAYARYYTHGEKWIEVRSGRLRDLYRDVRQAHLSNSLQYQSTSISRTVRWLSKLLFFCPGRRTEIEAEVMFLPAQSGGKLLDIGCGSGERMAKLQSLGWTVSGVDFDEKAVGIAKQRGLDVYCGTIPGIQFPAGTFDAITLNHVIEHVPDPVAVLTECERILKPGGKVVIATPNNLSWGRRLFKNNWRGLEPPRHLHVFSPLAMEHTLRKANFSATYVRTFDSAYIWRLSLMLKLGLTERSPKGMHAISLKMMAAFLNRVEQIGLNFYPSAGECLLGVGRKSSTVQEG